MQKKVDSKYIYSDLSREIIGICFSVYNELGAYRYEKIYQKAMAIEFERRNIKFESEVPAKIFYKGVNIGKRRFDFVVDSKVVVELKVRGYPKKTDYEQVHEYLKISKLKLGLLIFFSGKNVKIRRIINLY
ncbi:GxxExxY protein [Patescibacteria group bacterium]|nr:GxxExxY protein [Patescibacteria group bacterium]